MTRKREPLQSVSRIYDPLGLFSPSTLNAKLFKDIRELWKQEKDWDETFSESHQQEWNKILESLTPLSSQPLPNYIGADKDKLLCFADVSAKAYSAAAYLYSSVNRKANCQLPTWCLPKHASIQPNNFAFQGWNYSRSVFLSEQDALRCLHRVLRARAPMMRALVMCAR